MYHARKNKKRGKLIIVYNAVYNFRPRNMRILKNINKEQMTNSDEVLCLKTTYIRHRVCRNKNETPVSQVM